MRRVAVFFVMIMMFSCNKVVQVNLPGYEPELAIEMYLEQGQPLRCLLTESLPYTDTAINRTVDSAIVILSDGTTSDTLFNHLIEDYATGRGYNYYNPKILYPDLSKTYTLTVTDRKKRTLTGETRFSSSVTMIDSLVSRPSENDPDSFSVGVVFTDPSKSDNYYRVLMAKKLNDFTSDASDLLMSDMAFNGMPYSFFSEPDYARNDTVTVRLYSLSKQYYDYVNSVTDARSSNFSPFVQPAWIQSNISGGIGIFTAILFDQRKIIVR